MSTKEPQESEPLAPVPEPASAAFPPAVGAEKWTANSIFDRKDERKMGRAMSSSFVAHAVLFGCLIWVGFKAAKVVEQPEKIDVVYLQEPGPAGGGGGSPKPAPPVKTEVPRPVEAQPTPVVTPTPVDPSLVAPITTLSNMEQASGTVNFASFGGAGSGHGIGPGTGDGVGPGTDGGFGGGARQPGNGCADPQLVHQVDPKYTSEAMRAKLQGDVEIQAVIQKDGSVGDLRLTRSLDKQFGLDDAALKAARQWTFHAATCQGAPVDMIVTLDLSFRLH